MATIFSTPHLPPVPAPPPQTSYPDAIIGEIIRSPKVPKSGALERSDTNFRPQSTSRPTPHATHYLVSWHSNNAGIITERPSAVEKSILRARFPDVVTRWEEQTKGRDVEARNVRRRAENLARVMWGSQKKGTCLENASIMFVEHGEMEKEEAGQMVKMKCNQGHGNAAIQHWGEVRLCEGHPVDQDGDRICRGCRVEHWVRVTFGLKGRGARVPLCVGCVSPLRSAEVEAYDTQRCVCETQWKCWECREVELNDLARARRAWEVGHEGACGRCWGRGEMVDTMAWCVFCEGVRAYVDDQ
ncbi:hypothetical protein J1614_001785 [Plenodomus biglobosus]|nr:hypothetical protein J1614_001785 [Plenodomus biglobosus]